MLTPSCSAMISEPEQAEVLTICREAGFGLCVRVLCDFPAAAVVERFVGELSAERSQHSLQVSPTLHISGTRHIGYLSHGCQPNCRLDMLRSELITLRPVTVGEILTIDYAATEDRLFRQFSCSCGVATCRRWIKGRHEAISAAGRHYLAMVPLDDERQPMPPGADR